MRSAGTPVLALSLALTAAQAHPGHAMPRRAAAKFAPDADKAAAVADVFNTAWAGYHDHAFPNDTLHPVSNTGENDRNAWGVTPVDALSTAIIMGNKDVVNQILDFVPTIDFTTTQEAESEISVFETNIRYIGGLISAYDLLKGPFKDLVTDEDKVESLLKQVTTLADTLSFAFDTPSGIPDPTVILNPSPRLKGSGNNGIAGCGTLVLEWTRLTDITGNQTYTELTQKAEDHLLRPQGSPEAFPGLVGEGVSLETGEFLDSQGGWNAGTDSFYEYLIKMYLYDPEAFDFYRERWVLAADSTMEHLASHPTTRDDLTFLLQFDGPDKLTPTSGHLASFAGGNFILGGVLLGEQKYIDFGVHLAESYYATYSTAAGIGPEGFDWVDANISSSGNPPDDQADFYEKQGFWATSPNYILRPETMESLYYAYRATGDAGFQDKGWEAFQHIRDACRAGSGYSGLKDVTKADGGGFDDFMESFFLAETLKYAYLLFAEESEVQFKVDAPNGWVFNTEAHPVRVRA